MSATTARRVSFESSHVSGDFSRGTLTVRIVCEDDELGVSRDDEIFFEVPADFHSHNDSVAAALMTLVGRAYPVVTFNFPVSERCARILRDYYDLEEVRPVDPDLEPRQRGRYYGLMLSGGLDSMAVWLLLKRVLGDEFKVVTTDFGGGFAFEALGFRHFQRDVTCRTDFRRKGFDQSGRFTSAVPLLFADYADLKAIITGHHYTHIPVSVESLRDGRPPAFFREDLVTQAGGLDEVHIMRGLNILGQGMLALLAPPALLEAAWHGSSPPGSLKSFHKGLIYRDLFERQGRTPPAWLGDDRYRRRRHPFANPLMRFTQLYIAKRYGVDVAKQEINDIDRYDLSFLEEMTLGFLERYNTTLIQYIPDDLRNGTLAVFHEAGIEPYSERDWGELRQMIDFCVAAYEGRAPMRRPVTRS